MQGQTCISEHKLSLIIIINLVTHFVLYLKKVYKGKVGDI